MPKKKNSSKKEKENKRTKSLKTPEDFGIIIKQRRVIKNDKKKGKVTVTKKAVLETRDKTNTGRRKKFSESKFEDNSNNISEKLAHCVHETAKLRQYQDYTKKDVIEKSERLFDSFNEYTESVNKVKDMETYQAKKRKKKSFLEEEEEGEESSESSKPCSEDNSICSEDEKLGTSFTKKRIKRDKPHASNSHKVSTGSSFASIETKYKNTQSAISDLKQVLKKYQQEHRKIEATYQDLNFKLEKIVSRNNMYLQHLNTEARKQTMCNPNLNVTTPMITNPRQLQYVSREAIIPKSSLGSRKSKISSPKELSPKKQKAYPVQKREEQREFGNDVSKDDTKGPDHNTESDFGDESGKKGMMVDESLSISHD